MTKKATVLVLGAGGRESALVWGLRRSARVGDLYCAPGNPGTERFARSVPLDLERASVAEVTRCAKSLDCDLVVIGPEAQLVAGVADALRLVGIPVFGPNAGAADLEKSKIFAKKFMDRWTIPTATFFVPDTLDAAEAHLKSAKAKYPLVVKADGLCGGKGVVICSNESEALQAARGMMRGHWFGQAGRWIVIEDFLPGLEVSYFVLTDGESFVPLPTCRDYKRLNASPQAPNTGGMGGYSPSFDLGHAREQWVLEYIVRPTLFGLADEERPFQGVLYVGLMLTDSGPKVLEFNVRFGDPEAQLMIPRLQGGDWYDLLYATATGDLDGHHPRWGKPTVCVVMASERYPEGEDFPEEGKVIQGIKEAEDAGALVFHAGTALNKNGELVAAGGRVLSVVAEGDTLAEACDCAYRYTNVITWPGAITHPGILDD